MLGGAGRIWLIDPPVGQLDPAPLGGLIHRLGGALRLKCVTSAIDAAVVLTIKQENFRQVCDPADFGEAQEQIQVFSAVEIIPIAADLVNRIPADHRRRMPYHAAAALKKFAV